MVLGDISQAAPLVVIRSTVGRLLCNREILSIFNKLNSQLPVFNGLVVVFLIISYCHCHVVKLDLLVAMSVWWQDNDLASE